MGLAFIAIVGLVIVALTARTRSLARGGTSHRRLRRVENNARRDFTQAAEVVIDRYLAELPPEPRAPFTMDVRARIDLADPAPVGRASDEARAEDATTDSQQPMDVES